MSHKKQIATKDIVAPATYFGSKAASLGLSVISLGMFFMALAGTILGGIVALSFWRITGFAGGLAGLGIGGFITAISLVLGWYSLRGFGAARSVARVELVSVSNVHLMPTVDTLVRSSSSSDYNSEPELLRAAHEVPQPVNHLLLASGNAEPESAELRNS